MDFFTAAPYAAIPLLVLINALLVRRIRIAIRDEDHD